MSDYTLLHGDCLEAMAAMDAGSVDAVVTDPPYKLSQEYGTGADADNVLAVSLIWPVAAEMVRLVKPGGLAAMFYDSRILPLALDAMRHAGWRYLRNLTLYRRWGGAFKMHGWMSTSDFVLVFARPGAKPAFHGETRHDVYIRSNPEADSTGHPAQKPLEAVAHIVSVLSAPGDVVLDPFAGSGTTGVACAEEGREFIGIEREAEYVEIARRRIEAASSQTRFPVG